MDCAQGAADELSDSSGEPQTNTTTAPHELQLLTRQGVVRCPGNSGDATDPTTTSSLSRTEQFVAREHFKESPSTQAAVRISWLGATFRQRLLNKIEDATGGAFLRTFVVRTPSRSTEILADLAIYHETKLSDLWCLLSQQPVGQAGTLLTNATPNILHVRDIDGVLTVVDAVWGGAGWEIGASPVDGAHQWPANSQVIAR